MLLATMGFDHIRGYDGDTMEEHNFGTTLYPEAWYNKDGNNMKATMATKTVKQYGGIEVDYDLHPYHYEEDMALSDKVIVCTDSMDSRQLVYDNWLKLNSRQVFIDMRMDALTMSCITSTKDSDVHGKYWFPNGGSGEQAPCTMKHTIFCASLISGIGVTQLFNYLTERPFYQYIWQGLSPLDIEAKDFYCGETIVENNTDNILIQENVYEHNNSYSID